MTELTAVSLFAGVGGFDLALERVGIRVVAAVEIDDAARGVLATQFPESTLFTDVQEVTGDDLRAAGFVPERGVLTFGWPCQGNSVAGGREGMADPRSGLWREVVRLLDETRPRWFIGENVPGLLTVNDGDDIAVVRQDLAQLGYWWAERVLDAQHFGVPQRRRRVIFVGHSGDPGRAVEVLLEPEGSLRDSSSSVAPRTDLAATLTAGIARPGVSAPGRRQEDDVNLVVSTLQGGGRRGHRVDAESAAGGHLVVAPQATYRKAQRAHHSEDCERWEEDDATDCLDASGHTARTATAVVSFGHVNGLDIQPSTETTGTIRAGHDAMPSIATEATVRRLTPLECERLQGFPDNWTETSNGVPQADSARYRQMGNAVAIPVVQWVARRLVEVDV